jgi:hypothetical protein
MVSAKMVLYDLKALRPLGALTQMFENVTLERKLEAWVLGGRKNRAAHQELVWIFGPCLHQLS